MAPANCKTGRKYGGSGSAVEIHLETGELVRRYIQRCRDHIPSRIKLLGPKGVDESAFWAVDNDEKTLLNSGGPLLFASRVRWTRMQILSVDVLVDRDGVNRQSTNERFRQRFENAGLRCSSTRLSFELLYSNLHSKPRPEKI